MRTNPINQINFLLEINKEKISNEQNSNRHMLKSYNQINKDYNNYNNYNNPISNKGRINNIELSKSKGEINMSKSYKGINNNNLLSKIDNNTNQINNNINNNIINNNIYKQNSMLLIFENKDGDPFTVYCYPTDKFITIINNYKKISNDNLSSTFKYKDKEINNFEETPERLQIPNNAYIKAT